MASCFLLAGSYFFLVERVFLLILLILQLFQVGYRVHSDYPTDIDGFFLYSKMNAHLCLVPPLWTSSPSSSYFLKFFQTPWYLYFSSSSVCSIRGPGTRLYCKSLFFNTFLIQKFTRAFRRNKIASVVDVRNRTLHIYNLYHVQTFCFAAFNITCYKSVLLLRILSRFHRTVEPSVKIQN